MSYEGWAMIAGGMLLLMGLAAPWVHRLPVTTTMGFLGAGILLGPVGLDLLKVDPRSNPHLFLHFSEIAVVVSLFTVGAKLRLPLRDWRWRAALALAFGSMAITVGLITLAGVFLLELPIGAAVLLGAILAPTDPVLASDVQVQDAQDRDELRVALSGEAGFNDGTAFPFVMLGLGLLGLHDLGAGGWRWWTIDLVWAVAGGLAIGALLGLLTGRGLMILRRRHPEELIYDEYFLLGLIALAYGLAVSLHAYGFLAVFAAGVAVRSVERRGTEAARRAPDVPIPAEHTVASPAQMAGALLSFNEQMERILEVALVVLVGAALIPAGLDARAIWFVPLLFIVIRPLAVWPVLSLIGRFNRGQRARIAWFGVRGIGSVYYLLFVLHFGLRADVAQPLLALTFAVIAASIVLHGVSVIPLIGVRKLPSQKAAPGRR